MQILNHLILVLDVILYLVNVLGSVAIILLLEPVLSFLSLLGNRKDVLDGVCYDEVFIRFQAMNWPIVCFWNCVFLVSAVIREIAN